MYISQSTLYKKLYISILLGEELNTSHTLQTEILSQSPKKGCVRSLIIARSFKASRAANHLALCHSPALWKPSYWPISRRQTRQSRAQKRFSGPRLPLTASHLYPDDGTGLIPISRVDKFIHDITHFLSTLLSLNLNATRENDLHTDPLLNPLVLFAA